MMDLEADSSSSVGEQGEFVNLKVPDGMSLRNFGTQVPIFATLSDIVVYSPTGNIEAAKQLAQKFKDAVEKTYQDWVERTRSQLRGEEDWEDVADGATPRPKHRRSSSSLPLTPEEQAEVDLLLKYNVFVLDASTEDIYQHLEHLVARVEDINALHAHTDGTDAHTVGDPASPASASSDSPVDNDERRPRKKLFRANTVNFAQREKEEMRDLTRASELYTAFPPDHPLDPCVRTPRRPANSPSRNDTPSSAASEERLHEISASTTKSLWDPSLGQIFMGNTSDVPLPSDEDTAAIARREMKRLRRVKKASHHHYSTSTSSSSSYSAYQEDYQMDEDTYDDQMGQEDETFDFKSNDPTQGMGYDLCIECDDLAPFPTSAQMRAVEDHLAMLERLWVERCLRKTEQDYHHGDPSAASGSSSDVPMDGVEETTPHGETVTIPPRPPPNAASVVHLSFPSSVSYTPSLLPFITWLETLIKPVSELLAFEITHVTHTTENGSQRQSMPRHRASSAGFGPSSLPPPSAFQSSFLPSSSSVPVSAPSYQRTRSTSVTYPASTSSWNSQPPLMSLQFSQVPSLTARHLIPPYLHQRQSTPAVQPLRTRPLKILIYSADGYTESSSLALCLLMAYRRLSLPESYLELQIEKKWSFFVYQNEVASLKRVESRMEKERHHGFGGSWGRSSFGAVMAASNGERPIGRPPAQSVSFAIPPPSAFFGRTSNDNDDRPTPLSTSIPTESNMTRMNSGMEMANRRPRASTMSVLPSFADHQAWFNDPRFDGSFPSRVLPFLYLGNLNHASNVYMLHALGITHVVSVGECALVPPPLHAQTSAEHSHTFNTSSACQFVPGKGPGGQGSLWIEEREGRIKVLDIKGVCDDGIDTLEPQLEPICNWIDRARAEGGKVLVHCRVGMSRSATVTIAYVMKHLSLPLVDAYLIVRSRRLSVLIQPNMRLLYNLLGWEVKLAKECAGDNEERLRSRPSLSALFILPSLARMSMNQEQHQTVLKRVAKDSDTDQSVKRPRIPSSTSSLETSEIEGSDYCALCSEGGNLIQCQECFRAICDDCIPEFQEINPEVMESLRFQCWNCQKRELHKIMPYIGLYTQDNKPFLDKPIEFACQEYTGRANSWIKRSLYIIELQLISIPQAGQPAELLYSQLVPIYENCPEKLKYHRFIFDLNTKRAERSHSEAMKNLALEIESNMPQHILLFITTHSDKNSGNLFHCEANSLSVTEFSMLVITPGLLTILQKITTTIFFCACGALTRYQQPLSELQNITRQYHISKLFAFTALKLYTINLIPFVNAYVIGTVIGERQWDKIQDAGSILGPANEIGSYTSLVYINPESIKIYYWQEQHTRPYGKFLPIQCPKCFSVWSWSKTSWKQGYLEARCQGIVGDRGQKCNEVFRVKKPEGHAKVSVPQAGDWMVEDLKVDVSLVI
ncbi:hypothetical protein QCA50_004671 [Cerrena zonata]|uniref:Protein-tyrosine-phosphatase n=1 Tax=Cerrena zonata TaxID=2478898 RepID=A0AAW0GM48_9APHY